MTDLSTMERMLAIIAVSVAIQTTLMVGLAVAGFIAYRRTTAALTQQLVELQLKTQELSTTVTRAADSLSRGAHAVTTAIDDARQSAGAVSHWLNTAASVVATPRTAAAMGVLRGVQWWKHRRQAATREPAARA